MAPRVPCPSSTISSSLARTTDRGETTPAASTALKTFLEPRGVSASAGAETLNGRKKTGQYHTQQRQQRQQVELGRSTKALKSTGGTRKTSTKGRHATSGTSGVAGTNRSGAITKKQRRQRLRHGPGKSTPTCSRVGNEEDGEGEDADLYGAGAAHGGGESSEAVGAGTSGAAGTAVSPYGAGTTGMMYGAGYGGAGGMYGSYYGGGMMMSPYGGMMPGGMLGGPISGLNQFLFGVQNVIMSLGQAVQIVGMNTQALKHLLESAVSMIDHALAAWNEMQAIEAASRKHETEEMKKRRRRLRALRYAMVTAVSYAAYRIVRRIFAPSPNRQQQLTSSPYRHNHQPGAGSMYSAVAGGNAGGYDPYYGAREYGSYNGSGYSAPHYGVGSGNFAPNYY